MVEGVEAKNVSRAALQQQLGNVTQRETEILVNLGRLYVKRAEDEATIAILTRDLKSLEAQKMALNLSMQGMPESNGSDG